MNYLFQFKGKFDVYMNGKLLLKDKKSWEYVEVVDDDSC